MSDVVIQRYGETFRFSDRELAALPDDMGVALRLLAEGVSPPEIKRRFPGRYPNIVSLPWLARSLLKEHAIEELEQWRQEETAPDNLTMFGAPIRNLLIRNGITSFDALRRMTDADLLALRGFGQKSLALVRRHIPRPVTA